MEGKPVATGSLALGRTWTFRRAFEQRDFDRFAALSGDDNPIHVDAAFAAATRFGRPVSHGMLLYSAICRALTEALGPGITQLEQEFMFVTPTYAGEDVAIGLEVTGLPRPGLAELSTTVTRPEGAMGCQGRTVVVTPGAGPDGTASADSGSTRVPGRQSDHRAGPVGGEPAASPGQAVSPSVPLGPNDAEMHKGLRLGQSVACSRTFTLADLAEFRDLSGDTNPALSHPAYAAAQGWPGPRVPGPLLGGLFSYLLGTRLPGRGTNWLKQRLVYPAPSFAGEEITARVEIVRLRPAKDLVNLRGICSAGGRVVCEGESLVLVKDLEHA